MKISEKYESFNEENVETSKIDFKKLYNLFFYFFYNSSSSFDNKKLNEIIRIISHLSVRTRETIRFGIFWTFFYR
jgi:hypothetical protein